MKGRCLNRLTMEPGIKNSPCWTRTNDTAVNSRMLYRLSYRGISIALTGIVYYTFLNFASTIFIFFDTYLQNHILTNDHHSEYFTTFVIQLCGGHSKNLRFSSCHWLRQCLKSSRSDLMKVNFQRSPLSSFRRSLRPYWSSPRPISISQLHVLPHFHL